MKINRNSIFGLASALILAMAAAAFAHGEWGSGGHMMNGNNGHMMNNNSGHMGMRNGNHMGRGHHEDGYQEDHMDRGHRQNGYQEGHRQMGRRHMGNRQMGDHQMGQHQMGQHMMRNGHGYNMGRHSDDCLHGYGPGALEELSAEDRAKVEAARDAFFADTRDLKNQIRETETDLQTELGKSDPDREAVFSLQKKLSGLRGDLDQKSLAHRMEIRELLPDNVRADNYNRGHCR